MSSDSASTPSKLMFVVFGTRAIAGAVDGRVRHARQHLGFEPIAERSQAGGF